MQRIVVQETGRPCKRGARHDELTPICHEQVLVLPCTCGHFRYDGEVLPASRLLMRAVKLIPCV